MGGAERSITGSRVETGRGLTGCGETGIPGSGECNGMCALVGSLTMYRTPGEEVRKKETMREGRHIGGSWWEVRQADDPQLSRLLWECMEGDVINQSDTIAGEEKQALGNGGQWEARSRT